MDIDLALLRTIEREKEIPFDELVRIIEQAILTAYAQAHHARRASCPTAPARSSTARPVTSRSSCRSLDDEGAVIGEEETTPDDFGRIAAFAAKQVISQRLRDIADDAVLGEFRGKEGDIVAGVVQQGPNPRMVHVDLGTVEAILPPEEQVAGEEYAHGSRLRVYVTSVAKGTKGPQITVSRTHPGLVRKLFALEVPEIARRSRRDRLARPRGRATARRSPCGRPIPTINAKGACIGELGRRVRAVTEELGGEKIDIVDYDPELAKFVANALSPAKVTSSFILDADHQGRARPRARLPAVARDRQGGPERPPRRQAHRREDRHPARQRPGELTRGRRALSPGV